MTYGDLATAIVSLSHESKWQETRDRIEKALRDADAAGYARGQAEQAKHVSLWNPILRRAAP